MGPAGRYGALSLSPDGKRVAIDSEINGNTDLWLIDVQRGTSTRFTTDPALDSGPVWSPDGNRIFFVSGRVSGKQVITGTAASFSIYQKETGGVAGESLLPGSGLRQWPNSVSPDGRLLLVGVSDPKTSTDLWILPLDGERKPVPFVQTPFHEAQGQFSPAATGPPYWVAYASDESGTFEVYVQSYPAGLKYPISKGGGSSPRWRADGKELFYLGPGGAIMSVQVKTSPRFEASLPRTLFHARGVRGAHMFAFTFEYAVAPDGNRFLINTLARGAEPAGAVTVVLNWQAGIAARK